MKRISPEKVIFYISNIIEKNIFYYKKIKDKSFLCQNILSQLRNLVENIFILIYNNEKNKNLDCNYKNIKKSKDYVIKKGNKYKFLYEFHHLLQTTTSHYTQDDHHASRLISLYLEKIFDIKKLLKNDYNLDFVKNIEDFPEYDDESMKENYKKISEVIEKEQHQEEYKRKGKYYVNDVNIFFFNFNKYYELTLSKATDYTNKFEKILFYSKKKIPIYYSVNIWVVERDVELNIGKTKIMIITDYSPSIRICELKNINKILSKIDIKISSSENKEYINLMNLLKNHDKTILDIVEAEELEFNKNISKIKKSALNNDISNMLIKIRKIIINNKLGSNVIRYLLTNTKNTIIRDQLGDCENKYLSDLFLNTKCGPFEKIPYVMNLYNHITSMHCLQKSIDMYNKEDELFYRFIKNNIEEYKVMYTPLDDLQFFDNPDILVKKLTIKF